MKLIHCNGNWSWTAGCQAWPARLLTMLQILLATLGAAAVQTKDEGYPVLSAALLASIVLGLHMSVEALENVESFWCTNHGISLWQHFPNIHPVGTGSFIAYHHPHWFLPQDLRPLSPTRFRGRSQLAAVFIILHLAALSMQGARLENQEAWQSWIHRLKEGT